LNDTQSARRYARALIETATDTQAVRDDLAAVARTLRSTPALLQALANPGVPVASKKDIFTAVFSGLAAPLPRLFDLLIEGARIELVQEIARRYRDEWNARNNVHAARVVSAFPLDDDAGASIRNAIEVAVAGAVEMETSIDPALVGGLKVEVDGYMFDGSVKARLQALRRHLA
jgi:F-type H+-transporting ATPase subunit delta